MSMLRLRANEGSVASIHDAEQIRRAITAFADPASGIELCVLRKATSERGAATFAQTLPGNDVESCVRAIRDFPDGDSYYWCLNPVSVDLFPNGDWRHRVKVADVLVRRWLLVDIDPVRAEGHTGDSATREEKEASRDLALSVVSWLGDEHGWPLPVTVDSGNGTQLLWRVDLPADEVTRALFKRFLHALAAQADTSGATIDKSVCKANQLAKLPGTLARKGPGTADRPHRLARLLDVPARLQVITAEQIAEVCHDRLPMPSTNGSTLKGRATDGQRHAYAESALERECVLVKLATPGDRNNQLNKSAFALGQLVAGGLLIRQRVESDLAFAAYQCGLARDDGGDSAVRATIKSGLDAGAQQPRGLPEANGQASGQRPTRAAPTDTQADEQWEVILDDERIASGSPDQLCGNVSGHYDGVIKRERYEIYSLPALMRAEFPAPNWVIPGILSEGLNLLAGKPKMGKSIFALNLAITVAAGGKALGDVQTVPGDVLYLALEDKHRRLQGRAAKILKGMACEAGARLWLVTRWPSQTAGGLGLLTTWLDRVERPTLVIIDVWAKFRPAIRERGSAYEQDYKHLSAVKDYLDKHDCNSLVLHHTRKAAAEDVFDEISGTMGLSGVADGMAVLARQRGQGEAKIVITGRDIQETELSLLFDPESLTWRSLGDAGKVQSSKVRLAVLELFKANAGASFWPSEIAERIEMAKDTVRKELWRMGNEGIVKKVGDKYSWPADERQDRDEAAF